MTNPKTNDNLDGVEHCAPDIWLAARASTKTGTPIERTAAACQDWANGCKGAARYFGEQG